MHIYRSDQTNAGDWWSAPFRYFPFRPTEVLDIMNLQSVPAREGDCVIVGGGGLGRETFREALQIIQAPTRSYRLIAWGVGADLSVNLEGTVADTTADLLGGYFDGFDRVGTRVWHPEGRHEWVPCASCLHPQLCLYRDRVPIQLIGVYQHKRVPIGFNSREYSSSMAMDNSGDDIEEKLEFLSRFEYIITNSYHGVYWATLLNRKVLCLPFKSGLYSFRHKPVYIQDNLTDDHLHQALSYPNALEECRMANLKFYSSLIEQFGDL